MTKRQNRKCAYCGQIYFIKSVQKECCMRCRILNNVKKVNECWEWQMGITKRTGYGLTTQNQRSISAHRASFECFKGKIADKMVVMHNCDNKKCVNPDHLFLGTHKDNTYDMQKKGRMASFKGSGNSQSKVKERDIIEIRKMIEEGYTQNEIAKKYKLKQSTISDIKRRKNWSHL